MILEIIYENIFSSSNIAEGAMTPLPLRYNMGKSENSVFVVDDNLCFGCGACIALCPTNALDLVSRLAVVEEQKCTHCEHCISSCPVFALSIEEVDQ